MTTLPQELIDACVDFLSDDRDTLCILSESQRVFIRTTRYHLFHSVCIPRIWGNPGPGGSKRLHGLNDILDANPFIASCIRGLYLADGNSLDTYPQLDLLENRTEGPHQETPFRLWMHKDFVLPLVLDRLVSLEELNVKNMDWDILPESHRCSLAALLQRPSLYRVALFDSEFPSFADFVGLLSNCVALTDLELNHMEIGRLDPMPELEISMRSGSRSVLDSLSLTGEVPSREILDWIMSPTSMVDVSQMTNVSFHSASESSRLPERYLRRIITMAAGSLQSLDLEAPYDGVLNDNTTQGILRNLRKIEFLRISSIQTRLPIIHRQNPTIEWLISSLSQLNSPFLQSVHLQFSTYSIPRASEGHIWEALGTIDKILSGPEFPSLAGVTLSVWVGFGIPEEEDESDVWLISQMPVLKARGIVMVETVC